MKIINHADCPTDIAAAPHGACGNRTNISMLHHLEPLMLEDAEINLIAISNSPHSIAEGKDRDRHNVTCKTQK